MVNLTKNNTKLNITKKINQLHQNPQTKILSTDSYTQITHHHHRDPTPKNTALHHSSTAQSYAQRQGRPSCQ